MMLKCMKKPVTKAFLAVLSIMFLSCSSGDDLTGEDSDGYLFRLGFSSPISWVETDLVFDQALTLDKKVILFLLPMIAIGEIALR